MEKLLDRFVYLQMRSIPHRNHVPQPLYHFSCKSLQAITHSDSLRILSQDLEDRYQSTIFKTPFAYLLTFHKDIPTASHSISFSQPTRGLLLTHNTREVRVPLLVYYLLHLTSRHLHNTNTLTTSLITPLHTTISPNYPWITQRESLITAKLWRLALLKRGLEQILAQMSQKEVRSYEFR